MRIPRIYTPQDLQANSQLELEEAASRHIAKVLRMGPGRELILFNGQGGEYSATIENQTKKITQVAISQFQPDNRQSPLETELGIAISRGERMDQVIQKASELGVTAISPIFSERTEVKLSGPRLDKKLQHWQQIAISACEQSQRNLLPIVRPPQTLASFLSHSQQDLKLVLHHRSDKKLQDYCQPQSSCFLIGPEGGLSENEIRQAEQQGFNALTLGPRVLRTETAPIAALSLAQYLWGDFN